MLKSSRGFVAAVQILECRRLLSLSFAPAPGFQIPNLLIPSGQVQETTVTGRGDNPDLIVGSGPAGATAPTGTELLLSTNVQGPPYDVVPGPAFPAAAPGSTNVFAAAQLKEDDTLDLLLASESPDAPFDGVLTPEFNTSAYGMPAFTKGPTTPISLPGGFNPQQVLIGSFNGDAFEDVAVLGTAAGAPAGAAESLVVLTGNSDGTFTLGYENPDVQIAPGVPLTDGSLFLGDYNQVHGYDLVIDDRATEQVGFLFNHTFDQNPDGGPLLLEQDPTPVNLAVTGFTPGAMDLSSTPYSAIEGDLVVAENSTTGGGDEIAVFKPTGYEDAMTFTPTLYPAGNPRGVPIGNVVIGHVGQTNPITDIVTDFGALPELADGSFASPVPAFSLPADLANKGFDLLTSGRPGDYFGGGLYGFDQSTDTLYITGADDQSNVDPDSTAITLTSDAPAVPKGEPVTVTATVSIVGDRFNSSEQFGTATGSINLLCNGFVIDSSTLDATGAAHITLTDLPTGTDALTAAYIGSEQDSASTSAALNETVSVDASAPVAPVPIPTGARLTTYVIRLNSAPFVAGGAKSTGSVIVALDDDQAVSYTGVTTVELVGSTTPTVQGDAAPFQTVGLGKISIAAHTGRRFRIRLGVSPPAGSSSVPEYVIAETIDATGHISVGASTTAIVVAPANQAIETRATVVDGTVVTGQSSAATLLVTVTNLGALPYTGEVEFTAIDLGQNGAVFSPIAALNSKSAPLTLAPHRSWSTRLPIPKISAEGVGRHRIGIISSGNSLATIDVIAQGFVSVGRPGLTRFR